LSRAQKAGGHQEIEVKLPIADREKLLRQLAGLKAKPSGPRVHEMNTLYDSPDGRLARGGQMARIRVEHLAPPAATAEADKSAKRGAAKSAMRAKSADAKAPFSAVLTYKGPGDSANTRYKVREEHEVRIGNVEVLEGLVKLLGLQPWFRYEKFRTPYVLPRIKGVVLDFDETPVGDFLELEGSPAAIDRAARALRFAKSDYITKSYGRLQMESLHIKGTAASQYEPTPGAGVPDMVFSEGTKTSSARRVRRKRISRRRSS
jgi:adenylate cyclase, class 2